MRGPGLAERSQHGPTFTYARVPVQAAGVDDVTGEPLIWRKDDNAETLKARLVRN